jgi:hypothetical protein
VLVASERQLWTLRDAAERGDQATLRHIIRELVVRVELKWTRRPGKNRVYYDLSGGVIVYQFGQPEEFDSPGVTGAARRG